MPSLFEEYEKQRVLSRNLVGKTFCWNFEHPTLSSFLILEVCSGKVTYQYLDGGGGGLTSSRPLDYILANCYEIEK